MVGKAVIPIKKVQFTGIPQATIWHLISLEAHSLWNYIKRAIQMTVGDKKVLFVYLWATNIWECRTDIMVETTHFSSLLWCVWVCIWKLFPNLIPHLKPIPIPDIRPQSLQFDAMISWTVKIQVGGWVARCYYQNCCVRQSKRRKITS